MKFHPLMIAVLAAPASALAGNPPEPAKMEAGCENMIRAAVAALDNGYVNPDEQTGAITLEKGDLANVTISNVRVIHSACLGPDDCDKQNPDAFTWGADIGKKGDGLTGKVVVSYHRGNCNVTKFQLK